MQLQKVATARYFNWEKTRDIPTVKFSHYVYEAIIVFGAPGHLPAFGA
jgi:hypothetical protein